LPVIGRGCEVLHGPGVPEPLWAITAGVENASEKKSKAEVSMFVFMAEKS